MVEDAKTPESPGAEPTPGYPPEEIASLTETLGKVVIGASMSEQGGPISMVREVMGAMKASASYISSSDSPLLRQIVSDADDAKLDSMEEDYKNAPNLAQKAMDEGVESAKASHQLLLDKGSEADADAYAQLLLTAANAAIKATKTGSILGFGGEQVTPAEEAYVQRLAETLGYQKETA